MVHQSDKQYDPVELEKRIQGYWENNGIYHKVKEARMEGEDYYFVDGPPYTTGHIHLGTAWNKTLKDARLRYLRSMGYNVRDQAGFDMHGLPIEVKVEQMLDINNKKAIEDFGIDKFVNQCKEFALRFQKQMADQFKALGVWLDWENPYLTIMNYYIEGAWWTIQQAYRKNLLDTAERVLSWCPRCETALAEAEVEYWDETDPSIYVKFPVEGRENEYLVIWTTTPWTLLANLAVAVHPDFDYARILVRKDDVQEILIVLEERAEDVAREGRYQEMEIIEQMRGDELEGLKYQHPFKDIVEFQQRTDLFWLHKIVLADYVAADNTGLVHTAPGHGPDDFETGKQYDLPPFCPVDQEGKYTDEVQKYTGRFTKEADREIIEDLRERGFLLNSGDITHRYGHCWRCKSPITYRTTTQWFLRVSDVRDRMLEENARVKWTPEWAGTARFRGWVENTRDWCISRQRYWGIPIPVWRCEECDGLRVIGNTMELAEGKGYQDGMDLHRPWIDNVTFTCSCGGLQKRVKDVLDVWFDSAVCSWAQLHYPRVTTEFEKWWPTRWIVEAHDQTRGWFYSQLGASIIAFDRSPYDEVLMHGFALDPEGKPMSKSAGNVIPPIDVTEKYGVDSLRFYLLKASAPWEDLPFSMDGARVANRTLNILWNVYYFSTTYMSIDSYDPDAWTPETIEPHLALEDRWLLSRLESTVKDYNKEFRLHNFHRACRGVENFILEDLSRWYVRLIRDRTWTENTSENKMAAYFTLHRSLITIAELLSPITPHLSEELYLNLSGNQETISLEDWREVDEQWIKGSIDPSLEQDMSKVRDMVDTIASLRQKAGIKLRWPLATLIVESSEEGLASSVDAMKEILLAQGNIKSVEICETWNGMSRKISPNFSSLGPVFKGEARQAADHIAGMDGEELIRQIEAGDACFNEVPLTLDMISITEVVPEGYITGDLSFGKLFLDTRLTPELQAEAYSRELIRRVQEMRKEMNLHVEDRISTTMRLPEELQQKIIDWTEHIGNETRSIDLSFAEPQGYVKEWDIDGINVSIGVQKVN